MLVYEKNKAGHSEKETMGSVKLENDFAGALTYTFILVALEKRGPLTEKEIRNTIESQLCQTFEALFLQDALDALWFNEVICTIHRGQDTLFCLTDRGKKIIGKKLKHANMES